MSTLQFETTVAADGTITLPTSRYDAAEFVNKPVRVVVERAPIQENGKPLPEGFDPRLLGIVDPENYGLMQEIGDVISPIYPVWETMP
ncbi:MAG: hypothetical protein ACRC46_02950 [Thermoguttaceae bacterium]